MPVKVSAFAATLGHEIEVEDTLTAALRFEHGALGTIECATSCAPGAPRRIELCGTHGSAVLEDDRIVRWVFNEPRAEDEALLRGQNLKPGNSGAADPRAIGVEGHRRVIADMAQAVRENRAPAVDGYDGRKAVALIESIYAAALGR
jgi:predicted dehydrogenase